MSMESKTRLDLVDFNHIDKNILQKYLLCSTEGSHRFSTTLGWVNDEQYTYDDKYIDTCTWELHGISVSVHSQVSWAHLSSFVKTWQVSSLTGIKSHLCELEDVDSACGLWYKYIIGGKLITDT